MIVRRARIRLTLLFIAMFAIALAVFSLVFYGAFAVVLKPDFDIAPELTSQQVAEAAYDAALERVGAALIVGDLVAIVVVGAVAWILARRTLEPVLDAHRRQQRFVADASHETRNPLTAIKATTEAALSGGIITPYTPQACTGSFTLGNHTFFNVERGANESMTLTTALEQSCDTWFYRLGALVWAHDPARKATLIQAWARKLGLGTRPRIDLTGAAAGYLVLALLASVLFGLLERALAVAR